MNKPEPFFENETHKIPPSFDVNGMQAKRPDLVFRRKEKKKLMW